MQGPSARDFGDGGFNFYQVGWKYGMDTNILHYDEEEHLWKIRPGRHMSRFSLLVVDFDFITNGFNYTNGAKLCSSKPRSPCILSKTSNNVRHPLYPTMLSSMHTCICS